MSDVPPSCGPSRWGPAPSSLHCRVQQSRPGAAGGESRTVLPVRPRSRALGHHSWVWPQGWWRDRGLSEQAWQLVGVRGLAQPPPPTSIHGDYGPGRGLLSTQGSRGSGPSPRDQPGRACPFTPTNAGRACSVSCPHQVLRPRAEALPSCSPDHWQVGSDRLVCRKTPSWASASPPLSMT